MTILSLHGAPVHLLLLLLMEAGRNTPVSTTFQSQRDGKQGENVQSWNITGNWTQSIRTWNYLEYTDNSTHAHWIPYLQVHFISLCVFLFLFATMYQESEFFCDICCQQFSIRKTLQKHIISHE